MENTKNRCCCAVPYKLSIGNLGTLAVLALATVVLGAPPEPRPVDHRPLIEPIGPGAPVGSVFNVDADTKSFVEYVQSCNNKIIDNKPKLCDAYNDIASFYTRLEPQKKTVLQEAFSTFKNTTIEQLCDALNKTRPALKAISTSGESKYFKTLTDSDICRRRCADMDDVDEKLIVRPVCKVLAYQLQEINVKIPTNIVADSPKPETVQHDVPESIAGLRGVAVVEEKTIAKEPETSRPAKEIAQIPQTNHAENPSEPIKTPDIKDKAVNDSPPAAAANSPSDGEEKKKVADVTPGVIPKLAENIPPIDLRTKNSSTTEDYSNVLVSGNNESMDGNQVGDKQPGQDKAGGSLDNETGGDWKMNEEEYNVDPDDEEPAAVAGAAEKVAEVVPEENVQEIPQKKPSQVEDSFEIKDHAETVIVKQEEHQSRLPDDPFYQEADSNFFAYFMFFMVVCVLGYVFYHNKSKLLALMLEGRRSSGSGRGSSSGSGSRRRRKHTAQYQKLDSNLEEAISSTGQSRTSQIIY